VLDASDNPRELLGELSRLRRRARRSLVLPWFPLVCFGAVTVLGAGIIAATATSGLLIVWVTAGVAGLYATRRFYAARGTRLGVSPPVRTRHAALGLFSLCFVATLLAGWWGGQAAALMAPILTVLLGYAVLGWLNRDPRPPIAVAPAAAAGLTAAACGARPWLVEFTFGILLVAAGLTLRTIDARQRDNA